MLGKKERKNLHGPMPAGYLYPRVPIHPMCQKSDDKLNIRPRWKKCGFQFHHKTVTAVVYFYLPGMLNSAVQHMRRLLTFLLVL